MIKEVLYKDLLEVQKHNCVRTKDGASLEFQNTNLKKLLTYEQKTFVIFSLGIYFTEVNFQWIYSIASQGY